MDQKQTNEVNSSSSFDAFQITFRHATKAPKRSSNYSVIEEELIEPIISQQNASEISKVQEIVQPEIEQADILPALESNQYVKHIESTPDLEYPNEELGEFDLTLKENEKVSRDQEFSLEDRISKPKKSKSTHSKASLAIPIPMPTRVRREQNPFAEYLYILVALAICVVVVIAYHTL